jgi:SAM-dependent methyltransferase
MAPVLSECGTLLHVGCGPQRIDSTPFAGSGWRELRLDINPEVAPDLVGSLTDLSAVPDGSVDAVFSSHNLEHLYAHEVPVALGEFRRVLKAGGVALITCPDLQAVAALVAEDRLVEPAYPSEIGPITPHDILYGHGGSLAKGNLFMAHRCGFTRTVLESAVLAAGFAQAASLRRPMEFALWILATVEVWPEESLQQLTEWLLPLD